VTEFQWDLPPLSPADARLADAYAAVGVGLYRLPYSPAMDRLAALVGVPATDDAMHQLWCDLLRLSKQGRLVCPLRPEP
jgi:hypothetical protein